MLGIAQELVKAIRVWFPKDDYRITTVASYEQNMLSAAIEVSHPTVRDIDLVLLAKLKNRIDRTQHSLALNDVRAEVPSAHEIYGVFMGAGCSIRLQPTPQQDRDSPDSHHD